MPTNLEVKIKIDSFNFFEKKLKENRAVFKGILKQKDIYYNFSKGLLKLRVENDTYYLIKYLRDEKNKRWSNYEIIELKGKNLEKYLSEIFHVETVVEKTRRLYMYGDTRIHLDNVKGLGKFLELETSVTSNKKEATIEFNKVVKFLELNLSEQIRASYKNLLMK